MLVLFSALLVILLACASPTPQPTLVPTAEAQLTRAPVSTATSEPIAPATPTAVATPSAAATPEPVSVAEMGGNADVLFVRAVQATDGTWTFHVTVEHPDTGWEDYADGWDVLTPEGQVLVRNPNDPFTRLLLHPHENEQPFTRSQSGIAIPEGVTQVRVRAHDLVDGYGGREVVVDLAMSSGPDFEVEDQK
jgi:hypothetical protein